MNLLPSLLIVAIVPDAPIEERYAGAREVFHCPFDASWDKNFDAWPDEWTRRRGRAFPHYVTIELSDRSTPTGPGCLEIDLDGGAAVVRSPPIRVSSQHAYVLEGLVETDGLQYDQAYLALSIFDKNGRLLETVVSEKVRDSQGWKKLRRGPFTPGNAHTHSAVIELHLHPGEEEDLTGTARFGDVWLGKLPRIKLSANRACHVFDVDDDVEVTCTASGILDEDPRVVFTLDDVFGVRIDEHSRHLSTVPPATTPGPLRGDSPNEPPGRTGSAVWKLPVLGPGFYRVRATVDGSDNLKHRRELTLAVIDGSLSSENSEFGWSLPQGDRPLGLAELTRLLGRVGIGWVKFPLWYGEEAGQERIEELNRFAEQLSARGIELVGLLHDPPDAVRNRSSHARSPAEVFTDDLESWYPSLEPVLARMAGRVQWWQLGSDQEAGFVGYAGLPEKIAEIKARLDQLSHDAHVGFAWGWMNQIPESGEGKPPWRFLALRADPPLTHQELAIYLPSVEAAGVRRWVVLKPISRDRYPLAVRITDLVNRMIAAKIHGAEGLFVPDPFSTGYGLMNDDGTAGDLLLPWRTTALILGGAKYSEKSLQLPGGTPNRLFTRSNDAVMVVWNDSPTEETVYLGPNVRQVDLWGRTTVPALGERGHVIRVDTLPTFVAGIDTRILQWRQSFSLAHTRFPSVPGSRHSNRLRLTNGFAGSVSGRLELAAPGSWQVDPKRFDFQLSGGEPLERDFQITFPYDVACGRHPIRVDFEIAGEETLRFSIYRHVDVGTGDAHVDAVAHLDDRGELVVEQHLVNDTDRPVRFSCHVDAPGRRRQRAQIICPAHDRRVTTYRFPEGRQLVGKTIRMRAEQVDGPRVLNHCFVVQK
ncbi:MAG: hypothetical protein ACYTG0_15590 [Planctomycetota bacterium]